MSTRPGLAFSHLGIYVRDLARMEAFYTGLLGFTVTDRGDYTAPTGPTYLVFLSRDPDEHHQIVLATGRPETLAFNTLNQISFRVPDLAGLRALHAELPRYPTSDVRPLFHGNAMSVYFRDPEGNRIELFMDMPWYVTQPCGIPLELGRSDDEIWRWAEETARKLPGFRPRAAWRREMAERMGVA
jgi:catechol 2,3-dioxygenase-like lactoylglutathione lyase family enzyme